jgi:hypothetical protein
MLHKTKPGRQLAARFYLFRVEDRVRTGDLQIHNLAL